jgi:hypothetical protein
VDFFLHSVDMPFSGAKIIFKELNCKQLLSINKLLLNLPYQKDCLEDFSKLFLQIILKSIKNKKDFLNLNVLEYLMFLAKLRICSLGDSIELLSKEKTEEFKKIKFNFNLSQFIEKIFKAGQEFNFLETINTEKYVLSLNWPVIKWEYLFLKEDEKIINKILKTIPYFIKEIKFIENDKIINFKDLKEEQIDKLYNKLSLKVQKEIQNIVFKNLEGLSNYNIWNVLNISEGVNLYNGNYQNLIRMFFEENLTNILEHYYVLASKGFDLESLNKMSVADKGMFVGFVLKELEANQNKNKEESFNDISNDWGNNEMGD